MGSISVYTTTTNAIRDEFFIVEGIKSALLFADEVVVMDGGSTDNTLQKIHEIDDSRIHIYTNEWLTSIGTGMDSINRSLAIGRCTSDWCILMDSDEVFHEDYAPITKKLPDSVTDNIVGIEFNTLHFYRDYTHLLNGCRSWKDLYTHKVYMVRNGIGIHHGNIGHEPDAHVDSAGLPLDSSKTFMASIPVFHYGHVRTLDSYMRKTNKLRKRFLGPNSPDITPQEVKWIHPNELVSFSGTHPKVMEQRIALGTDSYSKIVEFYK